MRGSLPDSCRRIADSTTFQVFIVGVIIANAVVLGLETYSGIEKDIGDELSLLNDIFLGIFVVELAIRITAFGSRPQDYFRDGWNVFDFVVITAAFLPGMRENATLLRVIRLLRVVRIVTVFPDLRFLVRGMVSSLPPIGSMAMLTVLLIYIYGMVGWILFADTDPADWGNIGQAMLSLFIVLTLESWPDIMETVIDDHPAAWIYFVSYVLIASFLLINMVIAILINSLEELRSQDELAERLERKRRAAEEGAGSSADASERIALIREALDDLEEDLHIAGRAEAPGAKGGAPKVMRRFRG
jgi:voltage-gated sodium channel